MDAHWLKSQLALNPDKTKADLARSLGLEPPAVSKMLNGTRMIKAHEYMNMRRFFGLPVDGEGAINPKDYILKPLVDKNAMAEAEQHSGQWVLPASVLKTHTKTPSDKIRIFRVSDTFMEPEFCKDEHVLVDTANTLAKDVAPFIVSDGFGYMVRYCEAIEGGRPEKIKLSAHNKMFQPQTLLKKDFQIVGRVIAKLQWL